MKAAQWIRQGGWFWRSCSPCQLKFAVWVQVEQKALLYVDLNQAQQTPCLWQLCCVDGISSWWLLCSAGSWGHPCLQVAGSPYVSGTVSRYEKQTWPLGVGSSLLWMSCLWWCPVCLCCEGQCYAVGEAVPVLPALQSKHTLRTHLPFFFK